VNVRGHDEEHPVFRSLAAPGLEEDNLFFALQGLPVPSTFWGEGWPALRRDDDRPWCEDDERRRRHEALLRKWGENGAPPPA
jgi:hypothetical protein